MDKQSDAVSTILSEWKQIERQLEKLFSERNQQNTKESMEKGINLFLHFLMVSNETDYIKHGPIPYESFQYKPVNVVERLEFIQSRPTLFHSYRQLSELMLEQQKLYAKKLIKKSSKPLA
ncbi:YpoC family protein [Neobacillus rhizosphaerae]|uniref:YpoC family protein n=1 Tax=Neobacillus rhizosphaerae TaxID=2880965 RepID=UPI003D2C5217